MKQRIKFLGVLTAVGAILLTGCQSQSSKTTAEPPTKVQGEGTHLVVADQIKDDDFFVDSQWVKEQKEKHPETVLLEAGYGEESYQKGHLPEAVRMDTMEVESEESQWNLFDADQLVKAFLSKGITKETPLVVYGDDMNAACRVAFAAYYLGVDHVKILDGGKKAWEKAGNSLSTDTPSLKEAKDFGGAYPSRPEAYIKSSDDLIAAKKKQPDLVIASVRSWPEFIGETSGYDYIKEAGEIKDAVWAEASETAYDLNYFINQDGTLKDPSYIFKDWEAWGITKDKPVTFYCGTGWRNTTVFFVTKQKGWSDVSVQDGGWYQWNIDHQRDAKTYPVQIGDPRSDDVKILE